MTGKIDVYHDTVGAMGTRLDVVLTGLPPAAAAALCEDVFARVRSLETTLSRFRPDGETGMLNSTAAKTAVAASPFLWDLLGRCRELHRITGGAFDIAAAPLLRRCRLPEALRTEAARREALAASGTDRLVFDDAARTVRFAHPAAEIDFGAVGKGVALDVIRPLLVSAGVENALVSFGESSVLALGRHPYGDCWEIGLRHPVTDEAVRTLRLRDTMLSVSGLRRVTRDGVTEIQSHIVRPSAGELASGPATVAVTGGSGLETEALSTAWIASCETRPSFLARFPHLAFHDVADAVPLS